MPSQLDVTVGIDLGDRHSHLCLLDTESGEVIEEGRIPTTPGGFERRFSGRERMRIAIEAGTHSPWVSRLLEGCGHEVLVANARKLRLIHAGGKKSDRLDAENLARLARLDPRLLSPIEHRGEASQAHVALVRSRDVLIGTRTKLVNHVRGTVKSFGTRLPGCSAKSFHAKVRDHLPEALVPALEPVLEIIGSLNERIREYDRKLEAISRDSYPETALLRQVRGVGPLTALVFVLTLEEPTRFETSRAVGPTSGSPPAPTSRGTPTRRSGSPGEGTRR